nr:MAG: hypothetical protein 1 [Leviviridae sp.]
MPTQSVSLPHSCRIQSWYTNGVLWNDVTENYSGWNTFSEVRPVRDPSRRPTGWLPPKPHSLSVSTLRNPVGVKEQFNSSGIISDRFSGAIQNVWRNRTEFDVIAIPSGTLSSVEIAALLKLKDTRINIGVALGEARSTAATFGGGWSQIRDTANYVGTQLGRVAQSARSLKKGKWKDAKRHLGLPPSGAIPKNWLALQYGWLPLLSDIKGATDELLGLPAHSLVRTVKSSAKFTDDLNIYDQFTNFQSLYTIKKRSGVFVRLDYEPSNTLLQTATRVGLTNPLEVAWELVPFSFVIDWAYPLGNWLSALDASFGWTFKSGSCSTFQRSDVGFSNGPQQSVRVRGSWQGSKKEIRFTRTVYSDSPFPSPPSLKNPVSAGHLANGLSLIASVFGGKK